MFSEIEKLEQHLKNTKNMVDRRDLALRLFQNPDFRKVILEDFMVTESARLVHESADPALDPLQRADALSMAQAAGHLKRYLNMMIRMGDTAENEIAGIEETITEVRNEEDAL